jgi:hypothetical protein
MTGTSVWTNAVMNLERAPLDSYATAEAVDHADTGHVRPAVGLGKRSLGISHVFG